MMQRVPDADPLPSLEGSLRLTAPDPTDPGPTTDPEWLIKRTLDVNVEKGYELLFKRYYGPLCSYSARLVYDRAVAEDLVGEVFGQFWHHQRHRTVRTSFRAYLFTSVRHAALAHLRAEFGREQPMAVLPEVDPANGLPSPQQLLQFSELATLIEQTVLDVSPQSQRVFVMSRFEGRKNADIAAELQISVKTVEGHLTKVLNLLRRVLLKDGLLGLGFGVLGWGIGQGVRADFILVSMSLPLVP